jgi:hypothetical protein
MKCVFHNQIINLKSTTNWKNENYITPYKCSRKGYHVDSVTPIKSHHPMHLPHIGLTEKMI